MAYTKHGAHIPGTGHGRILAKPGKCGGVWSCKDCMREAADYLEKHKSKEQKS